MKVYTIGRSTDSNVYIDDPMVSRRHALLKVYASGKMELVDLSQNGTFVNGVKLKSNTPVPVSRKDIVKIAQVRILDWQQIPNPLAYVKYTVLAVLGVAVLILLISLVVSLVNKFSSDIEDNSLPKEELIEDNAKTISPEDAGGNSPIVVTDSLDKNKEVINNPNSTDKLQRVTIDEVRKVMADTQRRNDSIKASDSIKAKEKEKAKARKRKQAKKAKDKKDKDSKEYVTPIL